MKKLLKNLTIFTIGLVLFIIIPCLIISNYDNYDRNTALDENIISLQTKSQYDNLDVLFIGSSYCYSSINTRMLDDVGIKSYNLGIASAGVEFCELIVDDYLNSIKKYPRKVFITISPMTFSSGSDNFEAYPIHRYLEKPVSNLEIAKKYNHWDKLIMMYKKSIKKGIESIFFKKSTVKKNRQINYKGFKESSEIFSDSIEQKDKAIYNKFKEDQFDNTKYFDLVKMNQSLKSKGIDVVFIEIPTNKLHNYFNRVFLNDYENLMKKLVKNATVFRLDSTKFQKTNYRNIDHLNSSGASIVTNEIIAFLKKSGSPFKVQTNTQTVNE